MAKLAAAKKNKKIDFEFYAPESKYVSVVGSFNGWNPDENPMKKGKDGKWKTSISMPAGRYEFKYYIDGTWQNDQRPVECIPNEFGSWNSVVEVQ